MKNNYNDTYKAPLSNIRCFDTEDIEAFTDALVGFWGQSEEDWDRWQQERLIEDEVGAALIRSIGKFGLAEDDRLLSTT